MFSAANTPTGIMQVTSRSRMQPVYTLALFSFVRDPPDHLAPVVADQQAPIGQFEDRYGAAPDVRAVGRSHPACKEILGRAARLAFCERHECNLITLALRAVKRTVPGEERPAAVLLRELFAGVKSEVHHADMRADRHVG